MAALSTSTRRALLITALLAVGNSVALVVQAVAIADALGVVVSSAVPAADLTDSLRVLCIAVLARAVLNWATEAVAARAAGETRRELRGALLDAALRIGPEWIHGGGSAETDEAATVKGGAARLTSIATTGLDALDAYFVRLLPALVTAAVAPVLVGGWILLTDPPSAVLVLLTIPLIPLFAVLIGRFTEARAATTADATVRLSDRLRELVKALPLLTAFRRAEAQAEAVRQVDDAHRLASMSTLRVAFLSALALELIASMSVALVAVNIGLRVVAGDVELTTALVVLILVAECYLPLRAAGAAHHASEDGVEAVRRVREVIDLADAVAPATAVADRPDTSATGPRPTTSGNPTRLPVDPRRITEALAEHGLSVRGLRVRRRDRDAPDGLTFHAEPGEILRLDGQNGIGPSGSGKSTAFAVLLGLRPADAGEVRIGDIELSDCDIQDWRRNVAWVPQRPRFTETTVADELATATVDQEGGAPTQRELITAARAAAAGHLLGRSTSALSLGERQRVATARAFLRVMRGARLLLLDEPTAHLDANTAGVVTANVRRFADEGAVVVLANHRPTDSTSAHETADPALAAPTAPREAPKGRLRDLVDRRWATAVLLGALSATAGVALTGTAAWLIATASEHPPVLTLTVAAVLVRTFAFSKALLRYLERLCTHDAAFRLAGRLRVSLWHSLVRSGPAQVNHRGNGEALRMLVTDVDVVRDLVPRVLIPPLVAGVVGTAVVAVQWTLLPSAGLVTALALLTAAVGGGWAALTVRRRSVTVPAVLRRRVADRVLGILDGAADLVAMGADRRSREVLDRDDRELTRLVRREATGVGVAAAVMIAATGLAVVAVLALAADAVAAGDLDPAWAAVAVLGALAAGEAVAAVPSAWQQADTLRSAYGRLTGLGAGAATEPPTNRVGRDETALRSDADPTPVRLVEVDARWPGAAEAALREVTVELPPGSRVAVLGPSGAGKSTLVALLLGFLPAEQGMITRPSRVAWCPQDAALVSTTVRENLRLADPTADDEELRAALRSAGLTDFVDRLDTVVGGDGIALSGGEASRLSFARTLLAAKDADLVLLDEPTAALDAKAAAVVRTAIRQELAEHTVVHVTHHVEEAGDADLVLEVRDGQVRAYPELGALALSSQPLSVEIGLSGGPVVVPAQLPRAD
ncbi:thiol reductant ABC exporter subunit CydD [Actinoalloteichus hymeniacidonis]|uniref:ABC transporter ATP-binding protein n=1 Tax=Actinoalloteichus hymeniacidonis TaxID=340345 RepID=A0AAC9MWL6_9PSEU|nr:thiol reductant ABC exporter subunit CydD [Actinoalloteichus hymeniacidonis]AOS60962.1 ABC transporter ATP-binding protein [Actinoalloteichus hymeniacidonis]MBB5911038.1 ATP-binding cassette subfamily C protein CydCD [Actinoalloteichus hymeniacidonis]